jgi:polyisoprenoid-binding protein YceI
MNRNVLGVLLAVAGSLQPAFASDWTLDADRSRVQFDISNWVVHTVSGTLGTVTGRIHVDDTDVTRSTVRAAIDLKRIDTQSPKRDAHLQTKDFFDVASYPVAVFTSSRVERIATDHLRVTGDLVAHGVVCAVTLDVHLAGMAPRLTADATATIDRHQLGLNYGVGATVGNEATLRIHAEATPLAASP